MYTLTLNIPTIAELQKVVGQLGETPTTKACACTSAEANETPKEVSKPRTKKEAKAEVKEVVSTPPLDVSESEPSAITYDEVKNQVLAVVKKLGRDSSLDLLATFGVTKGQGAERTGNITSLKPEQYGAVIDAAKKLLADYEATIGA